jgi:hypothetical protein
MRDRKNHRPVVCSYTDTSNPLQAWLELKLITKILSLSCENKSTKNINPNRKNQLEIHNRHCNPPVLTNCHEQITQPISRKNIWKSLKQKNLQFTNFCTYEADTINSVLANTS